MVVLGLDEIGQPVVRCPARIAELPPEIVVGGMAAHADQTVDRTASPQKRAARVGEAAAVETGLGGGGHHPVGARIADAIEVPDGNVHPVTIVRPGRFEQEHAALRIGAQPVGKNAACGSRPEDAMVLS